MTAADYIAIAIIVLSIAGLWATYKYAFWWNKLKPSRFLAALAAGSILIDMAVAPLVYLSVRRLADPDGPPLGVTGVILLGFSLIILISAKTIGAILFRDLDDAGRTEE
jgi:hypothetical protein